MRILVLNSGSSSLKCQLLDMSDGTVLARGAVERIGESTSVTTMHVGDEQHGDERTVADHEQALTAMTDLLDGAGLLDDLGGIGHRVVHGGERFVEPTLIDDEVVTAIRDLAPLAPLHNPANATGIEVARRLQPRVPQVAVFDTSFHATLPPHAFRYAVPEDWYAAHGVRKYGFHGTSHGYVARRAREALGLDAEEANLITAHLGNGASVAAIAAGRCVDTSMGLSPLEGLVMGTRSGDLDPTVIFHVMRSTGATPDEVEQALNRRSGLLGLAGDNDVRDLQRRADGGDDDARLALDVMAHRLRKYVGAYTAVLGRVDALVFTAGIGEHSPEVRAAACRGLDALGIVLDPTRNEEASGPLATISADDSTVTVMVVATDEEREIATQTAAVASRRGDDAAH